MIARSSRCVAWIRVPFFIPLFLAGQRPDAEAGAEALARAQAGARGTVKEMREIIFDPYPQILATAGLPAALEAPGGRFAVDSAPGRAMTTEVRRPAGPPRGRDGHGATRGRRRRCGPAVVPTGRASRGRPRPLARRTPPPRRATSSTGPAPPAPGAALLIVDAEAWLTGVARAAARIRPRAEGSARPSWRKPPIVVREGQSCRARRHARGRAVVWSPMPVRR
ncbi:hypothetical protein ACH427_23630 [Streptomyces sp. NPDC020379]|uniref:hypothetical protein n=1 Tax=Streptomyces sp. NPDC020379 TaxID=3365071 RepID=UPI0037BD6A95